MAINVNAASASALSSVADAKASSVFTPNRRHSNLSFALSPKPKVEFLSKVASGMRCNVTTKAQSNKFFQDPCGAISVKVGGDGSLEAAVTKPETHSSAGELASQETISEFMTQVTNLVKLVDSRDIVELQMKQLDCELLIRKKEAMTPLVSPSPVHMMQTQPQLVAPQVAFPSPSPTQAPVTPSPASPPLAPKPSKSSLPALKSPMAGTFYRSPAPGAPPFVKADQSGTIVEIVAEDTKPVSFDTVLLGNG
ncbi:hypothetical protein V2J09_000142 [Rumex salicifolius]